MRHFRLWARFAVYTKWFSFPHPLGVHGVESSSIAVEEAKKIIMSWALMYISVFSFTFHSASVVGESGWRLRSYSEKVTIIPRRLTTSPTLRKAFYSHLAEREMFVLSSWSWTVDLEGWRGLIYRVDKRRETHHPHPTEWHETNTFNVQTWRW